MPVVDKGGWREHIGNGQAGRGAMEQLDRRAQRLVALCMLGCVLFNFPVLAIFNVPGFVLGIPVLYAYIFVAWALLIALMAVVVERGS
jgi:hypothetical protein